MTTINGQTKLLGLLGKNIAHSKSFQLHNYCLQKHSINALYLPFQMAECRDLAPIWNLDHFLGANVTMPFKHSVMASMDVLTDTAMCIGAVNTIHKINGQLIGDNTDGIGFLSALEQYSIPWKNQPIYIIGAGGAAKAVCWALSQKGVKNVSVWNRTPERIEQLTDLVNVHYWDRKNLPSNAILIQCTPIGRGDGDLLSDVQLHSNQIIIDLLYLKTPLLKRLESAGGLAITGLGMLVHQAAYSFSQWFQCPPPIDLMMESLSNRTQMEM